MPKQQAVKHQSGREGAYETVIILCNSQFIAQAAQQKS